MKIKVHIERLILEDLTITSGQAPQVRRAVEKSLTHLLMTDGLSDQVLGNTPVKRIHGGSIHLATQNQPTQLGQSIARAVYKGIGNSGRQKSGPTTSRIPR